MRYRICKTFEIESGHMLFKHPSLCRFPHGHSRRIEVVISAERLDAMDMVCDFKTVKLALTDYLKQFDHAMVVNSDDPIVKRLEEVRERVITLEQTDPTTEVLAKLFYERLAGELGAGREYRDEHGNAYRFPQGLTLERVRVWETSTSWAEYGAD